MQIILCCIKTLILFFKKTFYSHYISVQNRADVFLNFVHNKKLIQKNLTKYVQNTNGTYVYRIHILKYVTKFKNGKIGVDKIILQLLLIFFL